ncbi:hypothetical protein AMECASPLE_027005 [Ameca splendens]|uniref:Uncharacterized protein n=1 Tax=Ameca splendens TaxID=208324 RepID=A0ABV0XI07_9TELE
MLDSMTARCPPAVAVKISFNHHASTTVLHSWYVVFVLTCSHTSIPKRHGSSSQIELCKTNILILILEETGLFYYLGVWLSHSVKCFETKCCVLNCNPKKTVKALFPSYNEYT